MYTRKRSESTIYTLLQPEAPTRETHVKKTSERAHHFSALTVSSGAPEISAFLLHTPGVLGALTTKHLDSAPLLFYAGVRGETEHSKGATPPRPSATFRCHTKILKKTDDTPRPPLPRPPTPRETFGASVSSPETHGLGGGILATGASPLCSMLLGWLKRSPSKTVFKQDFHL